jgi:O-antigen/teichoic acid export membrane protein
MPFSPVSNVDTDQLQRVDDSDLRRRREQRIRQSVGASLVFKPLAVIVPLVTLPLFLAYLGPARYGLYESAGAIAIWLAMTNVGMGVGLINRLTECEVHGDRELAGRYVSTLAWTLCGIAAVVVAAATLLVPLLPWAVWLRITDVEAASEAPDAIRIACIFTALSVVAGLAGSIYTGYQESHRNIVWDGVTKVATLVAAFLVVLVPSWGAAGVLMATAGVPAVIRLGNLAWLLGVEKPWLRPSFSGFDRGLLGRLLGEGILMFLLQAACVLLFQSDKLVIATDRGMEEVAAYSVVGRIFLMGYGLYMMYLTPLWPAAGEAIRRGDIGWVTRRIRSAAVFGVMMMTGLGLCLLVGLGWGEALLRRLTQGADVPITAGLVIATTAMFACRAWVDAYSTALSAAGILRPQLSFYVVHAVLNLALSLALVGRFGAEGVAWCTAATAVVTSVWGYPLLFRRRIVDGRQRTAASDTSGMSDQAR